MSLAAQTFIAALIDQPAGSKFLAAEGKISHVFLTEDDEKLWDFVQQHLIAYGKLPERQTIAAHAKVDLPQALEPPGYYLDLLRGQHLRTGLAQLSDGLREHLAGDSSPVDLLEGAQSHLGELAIARHARQLHDFREAAPKVLAAFYQAQSGQAVGFSTGWPYFDKQTGGLGDGDLLSFVGRPGQGKSWMMLWVALHMWRVYKIPILFVSMEMSHLVVFQRLAAIFGKKAVGQVMSGTLSTHSLDQFRARIGTLSEQEVPFWVLDANLAGTVDDIAAISAQLKPGATLVDGGYLLGHPKESDIYKRVALNANLMKQQLTPRCPVVVSWQFARTAAKKKKAKNEQIGLEDIGYSDAIGQVSSIVIGITEDDSSETIEGRKLFILKGRGGQVGEFRVKWDFEWTTDFSEVQDVDVFAEDALLV